MDAEKFCNEAKKYDLIVDPNDTRISFFGQLKIIKAGLTSDDDDSFQHIHDMIKKGTPIDLELIHLDSDEKRPQSGFYVAEYSRSSDQSATINFRRLDTSERLPFRLTFGADGSLSGDGSSRRRPRFQQLCIWRLHRVVREMARTQAPVASLYG